MGDGAQGPSLPSPVCWSQEVGLKVLMCFALLCFADTALFYKLKVCGNSLWSRSIRAIFPTALFFN